MIRIAGILCGSAIAIAFLIVALGIPEFRADDVESESTAALELPLQPEIPDPVTTAAPVENTLQTAQVEMPPTPIPPAPLSEPADEPSEQAATHGAQQTATPTENWFAFWSPFRSEVAANGFIAKLQRETGMDYRVVKVKTGIYEVAFAYDGEADIEAKLATISRATGLEMPDG